MAALPPLCSSGPSKSIKRLHSCRPLKAPLLKLKFSPESRSLEIRSAPCFVLAFPAFGKELNASLGYYRHGVRVSSKKGQQHRADQARHRLDRPMDCGAKRHPLPPYRVGRRDNGKPRRRSLSERSEEHTSELQSLMRISYA